MKLNSSGKSRLSGGELFTGTNMVRLNIALQVVFR
jgi:hypothetical protein